MSNYFQYYNEKVVEIILFCNKILFSLENKVTIMSYEFELGPIRPPSEAMSILIRVTRNCPWNKCTFCKTYTDQRFSRRSAEEIKKDIDSIHDIAEKIVNASNKFNGEITHEVLREAMGNDTGSSFYFQQVAFWLQCGMNSVFLQDANSLILKTSELVDVLKHINDKFPNLERITTYSRAKTVSKKSVEELKEIREAGLTRLHIGMESGSDKILQMVKKGVTQIEQISAGKKAIEAGFDLSEYYMPGLGGKELSKENAIESAKVINEINPTFIRIRSTSPIPGTELYKSMTENEWIPLTEIEKVEEIKLFIENLEGITSNLLSDHMMNLIENLEGKFPEDKNKMIDITDKFLNMSQEDKESFIIGRRLGYFRFLDDFYPNRKIDKIKSSLMTKYASVDEAIMDLVRTAL